MAKRLGFDHNRKQLLLVAGASGSGKSTFVRELLKRGLSPDIQSLLPPDAAEWPEAFGVKRRWRGYRQELPENPRGQILHYEITEPYRRKRRAGADAGVSCIYAADQSPSLMQRIAAAEEIHVVVVRPTQARLIQQLSWRTAVLHFPVAVRGKAQQYADGIRRFEAALPAWVTDNASKVLGRGWEKRAYIRTVNDELCDLYADAHALESMYEHWEASFRNVCSAKQLHPFIYVEPAAMENGEKAFQLASPPTENVARARFYANSR